jgi:outer membrane protein OmpA-like peptidoglycan-associated protein
MMVLTLLSLVILANPTPPEGVVGFKGGRGLFRVMSARTLPRAYLGAGLEMNYTRAGYPRDTTGTYDVNGSLNDKHHYGLATLALTYSAADFLEFFTSGDFYLKLDEQEGSRDDEVSWFIQEGAIGFKTGGIVAKNATNELSWSPGIYGKILLTPSNGPDSDTIISGFLPPGRGFAPFAGHDPDGEFGVLMDFDFHPLTLTTNLGYLATGKPKDAFLMRSQEIHWGAGLDLEAGTYFRLMLEVMGERIVNDSMRNSFDSQGARLFPDTVWITPGFRFVSSSGFSANFGADFALTQFDFIPDLQTDSGDDPIWNIFMNFSVTSALLKAPEAPPVATLTGKITDKKTGEPLGAEITFPGTEIQGVASNMETGIYKATLKPGPVRVRASKEGYKWAEKGASLKKNGTIIVDFNLEKKVSQISTITGRVEDAKTGKPMGAMISLPDLPDIKAVATKLETGIYTIDVPPGTHNVKAEAEGFEPVVAPVVLAPKQTKIQHFTLKPKKVAPPPPPPKPEVKVGQRIVLRGIYFSSGSARIQPRSYPILDDAVKILNNNPTVRVEIQGHTDSVGKAGYNLNLSQSRAEAVRSYIISTGVKSDRLVARGYGEDMPVSSNLTTEGRSENRRIEFLILSR